MTDSKNLYKLLEKMYESACFLSNSELLSEEMKHDYAKERIIYRNIMLLIEDEKYFKEIDSIVKGVK